ncbi:MAG: DUF4143 domain-containing protein [Chitinivibrionales bacterium]|nr:DUF4143 domain-containing protein [Chitinivibrionales bacterium]
MSILSSTVFRFRFRRRLTLPLAVIASEEWCRASPSLRNSRGLSKARAGWAGVQGVPRKQRGHTSRRLPQDEHVQAVPVRYRPAGRHAGYPPKSLVTQDYGSYKGFMAECFVGQELRAAGEGPLYAWQGRTSEIEFLLVRNGDVIPVEVKSGTRARSHSLIAFCRKYDPALKVKLTARNLDRRSEGYHNYPLYLASRL